jgi:hypothetical protein
VSEITASARVSILLADYSAVDGVNKVNALGLGWQVTGIDPETGNTAPQTVVAFVDVAPQHVGESYAFELALYDDTDALVRLPGLTGELEALRIGQSVVVERPVVAGHAVPPGAMWSHAQVLVNFPAGLALTPGRAYTWRVRIDNDDDRVWNASFYVAGARPGPVRG